METMFPGKVNSPATTLDGAIDNTVTTIDVIDGSVLPTAPNIAVIGTGEDAETILYGTKATNQLTSVTRGYQGVAKAWDSGETIARMFTEKDYANLKANIEAHETDITEIEKVVPRKIKTDATAAPAVTNDTTEGYAVNSLWIDVTNDKAYICVDATDGAAVWVEITSQGVGDALTTDPLSQFAATTSAQLAGVISDETGTDKLVYNTSPTLVTPILGTPTSGNLTNCTFPTLNQDTTGSAATLTTSRNIGGVAFNGSANIVPNIVTDTTPELGGNLDAKDKNITGAGSISFTQELDNGSKTANFTVDFATDQKQKVTMTENTFTLTLDTTDVGVGNYLLKIVNGGLATLTWASESGSVYWAGGTAPDLTSSGTDIVALYFDGTHWWASASLDFS